MIIWLAAVLQTAANETGHRRQAHEIWVEKSSADKFFPEASCWIPRQLLQGVIIRNLD
jgi:hypothetical protein